MDGTPTEQAGPMRAVPLARAFGSARFRMLLAGVLAGVVGLLLVMLLLARAGSPTGQFGIDATDYLTAAQRLADGRSPYAVEMLAGPVDAQGTDRYRYPPTFAQLLIPLTALDQTSALWLLALLQISAIVGAVLLALRLAGLLRPEPVLWGVAATVLFLPTFDSIWKGNVSGVLALLVVLAAMGGATGGAAVAIATLLKVAPVTFVPAWFVAGSRSRWAMVGTGLAIAVVSALLAPGAWRDYLTVLPNLLAGAADDLTNLAPWSMAARTGLPWLGSLVRLASLALVVGSVVGSVLVIRRPGGLPAAATLATLAMLLLPAALWYHYLVVLVPLAILAWPAARTSERGALVVAGAMVSAGVAWLPLATVGAAVMICATLRAQLRGVPSGA